MRDISRFIIKKLVLLRLLVCSWHISSHFNTLCSRFFAIDPASTDRAESINLEPLLQAIVMEMMPKK